MDHVEFGDSFDLCRYLKTELQQRVWTLRGGLGAMLLAPVDVLGDAGQFLLRLPGARGTADFIQKAQTDARTALVGPATDGAYEVGVLSLGGGQ